MFPILSVFIQADQFATEFFKLPRDRRRAARERGEQAG